MWPGLQPGYITQALCFLPYLAQLYISHLEVQALHAAICTNQKSAT